MKKITYAESGVDIAQGNTLVEGIKTLAQSTFNENVIGGIGSFSGAFALPQGYKEPVILAATDGVGTKLRLAIESNRLDTVGIDLVAMCVNDLICNFATPLFFLDYYATGKLEVHQAMQVIKGIAQGCKEAECALIGGESAEMPGMYHHKDFDLAGFSVGIAEKSEITQKDKINIGDVLIGIPSSGLHSNGYSLVRKIIEVGQYDMNQKIANTPLIDLLLEPTRIYVKLFKQIKPSLHALAHITGGGIIENLPRILTDNQRAVVQKNTIPKQPIFDFLCEHVEIDEAYKTFNMGVGMILALNKNEAQKIAQECNGFILGEIVEGNKGVDLI